MNKRKYLIMMALTVITLSLSGCGSQEETSADEAPSVTEDNQVTENATSGEQAEEAETNDDVQDSEAKAETDTTEDARGPEVEVETEPTEDTDEPEVEMVDFETWAKQEGNEEPCLVVWNETTETQRIIKPMEEYVIQEGDRFAVPYKENLRVKIGEEVVEWESLEYTELHLPQNESVEVFIFDNSGETPTMLPHVLVNE